MTQTLKQIQKGSREVYLAADDGALVYDDGDDTYLVIRLADALSDINKNAATLTNISKS